MLFSVEQAFAGKDERRAPLKTPAWEVIANPLPGQYLTHAHSHITRTVAAMDSCFALVRAHQHGDMAVRVREILARPWVGICVLLALKLS